MIFWRSKSKYLTEMKVSNFPKIVKQYLGNLPQNDYPALDTFTFVSCWLSFGLDQSLHTMRELFFRLNARGIPIDISTFSKASKVRDIGIFIELSERIISFLNNPARDLRLNLGEHRSPLQTSMA